MSFLEATTFDARSPQAWPLNIGPLEGPPFDPDAFAPRTAGPPPPLSHSVSPSPLVGPKICIRWFGNLMRLSALENSDRLRAARGMAEMHQAEIDRLKRSDLSPGVGRYYHFPLETDDEFERQLEAEVRRLTRQSDAPLRNTNPPNSTRSEDTEAIPSFKSRALLVAVCCGVAQATPHPPKAAPPVIPSTPHPLIDSPEAPPRAATESIQPAIQTLATATQSLTAALESHVAAIEANGAAVKEHCAAMEAFLAATESLRPRTKSHRKGQRSAPQLLQTSARRRQSSRPTRAARRLAFPDLLKPALDKWRADRLDHLYDPAVAATQSAVAPFINTPEIDTPEIEAPIAVHGFRPSAASRRTMTGSFCKRASGYSQRATLLLLVALLIAGVAWLFRSRLRIISRHLGSPVVNSPSVVRSPPDPRRPPSRSRAGPPSVLPPIARKVPFFC